MSNRGFDWGDGGFGAYISATDPDRHLKHRQAELVNFNGYSDYEFLAFGG
jgi:hypothetical protein